MTNRYLGTGLTRLFSLISFVLFQSVALHKNKNLSRELNIKHHDFSTTFNSFLTCPQVIDKNIINLIK